MHEDNSAELDQPLPTLSLFETMNAHQPPVYPSSLAGNMRHPFMTSEMHAQTLLYPFSHTQTPSHPGPVEISAFQPHLLSVPFPGQPPMYATPLTSQPVMASPYPTFMEGSSRQAQMPSAYTSAPYTRSPSKQPSPTKHAKVIIHPLSYQGPWAAVPPTSMQPPALAPAPTISPSQSRHSSRTPGPMSGTRDPSIPGSRAASVQPGSSVPPRTPELPRPDYLVRAARADSPSFFDRFTDEGPIVNGMGIAVSPMKGRRLQLFQETSEESFEQSLMAGGYGKYGTNPAGRTSVTTAGGPQGVHMHQRTAEWLDQAHKTQLPASASAAPVPRALARSPNIPPPVVVKADPEPVPQPSAAVTMNKELDANELLRRKRLAAFQENGPRTSTKLRVVDVEGFGRMLLDVPNVEPESPVDDSPKKKKAKPKKKPVVPAREVKPKENEDPKGMGWVDSAFPWSLRINERAEHARQAQSERLHWIERYLERESDSDGEDVNDATSHSDIDSELYSPFIGSTEDLAPDSLLRPVLSGTMRSAFRQGGNLGAGRFVVPSETADARWQLTNLSIRRRAASGGPCSDANAERGRDCVCLGSVMGPQLVQCDECDRWYHLACLDIEDAAELGEEDEPWYCHECTGAPPPRPRDPTPRTPSPVMLTREPAFYTGTPARHGLHRDPVVGFAPAVQESPMPSWPSSLSAPAPGPSSIAIVPPATPLYSGTRSGSSTVHSSRSTTSRGHSDRATSHMPQTPKSAARAQHTRAVRVFGQSSPAYDDLFVDEPFDPAATPSRMPEPRLLGFETPASKDVSGLWLSTRQSGGPLWNTARKVQDLKSATLLPAHRPYPFDIDESPSRTPKRRRLACWCSYSSLACHPTHPTLPTLTRHTKRYANICLSCNALLSLVPLRLLPVGSCATLFFLYMLRLLAPVARAIIIVIPVDPFHASPICCIHPRPVHIITVETCFFVVQGESI